MERVEVNGVQLEVQRIQAPVETLPEPIVFLHEGLGSVEMWGDWPARLCEQTRRAGIVYSRRGYGRSDPIPDVRGAGRLKPDYLYREALEALPALLDELDIERPILLGHSDGATIALIHAGHFPVRACIAMAPHVIVEDVTLKEIAKAREAYEKGDLRNRLSPYHADVDCAFWQWNDVWLSPAFREFDMRVDCRHITAAVLAIQGDGEPYGTQRQLEELAPTQGLLETEILRRCGHSPHRDQPEHTIRLIVRFLSTLP